MINNQDIKCVCHNILLREAIKKAPSVEDLQKQNICGNKCKMCVKYAQEMYEQNSNKNW